MSEYGCQKKQLYQENQGCQKNKIYINNNIQDKNTSSLADVDFEILVHKGE